MRRPHQVEPRWVIVEGALHQVSEFAHLTPRQRPPATCPVCDRSVLLKLGTKRVHHYAHQPEDVCAATQPETALHLNTKFYLYQQLGRTDTIMIEETCLRCARTRYRAWVEGWDTVMVERGVGSFRPDISLYRAGEVIGAIEVLVTHRVNEQKAKFFREAAIDWLEIAASETLYEGPEAWLPAHPLPFARQGPTRERWVCEPCQEEAQRQASLSERERARRDYEAANYQETVAAKMVDFYFRSGRKYREVYYVVKLVREGKWVRTWVKTEAGEMVKVVEGALDAESELLLRTAAHNQLKQKKTQGALVDVIIPWQPWVKGKKFVARDLDRFPFRYEWNPRTRQWQLRSAFRLIEPPEW